MGRRSATSVWNVSNHGKTGEGSLPLHWEIQRCHSSKVQPSVGSSPPRPCPLPQAKWLRCTSALQRIGEKFDSGFIGVIAENKKKDISFNVNVSVDEYKTPSGEMKQIKRYLQFIDSIGFMSSILDLLSRNLVGVDGMVCEWCGSEVDLAHISENNVTHRMFG